MFVCMGAAAVEAAVLPAAIAALPVAPVVGSAAIGTMALLGIRRQRQEQKAFFSMEWNQNVEDEDAEECVILGEETAGNGKIWYVCNEKSEDSNMDCQPVSGYGNPDSQDDQWLCKQPKPRDQKTWQEMLGMA